MTKTHEGKLQSPYFEFINDGKKKYEMRVFDDKRKNMNVGDYWNFKHNDEGDFPILRTKIVERKIYKSFEEAINDCELAELLPHIKTIEEAIRIYENFDNGQYKINADIFGVVNFKLAVV